MSGLFARALADKITSNVFSDPPYSEGDSASRKRVGFLPWTTNILEPQLSTPDSEIPPSLKSLPPSRDCQLTVRPILKPSLSSQSVLGLDGQNEKTSSLANMDSLLRNLAVNERSSSVDAYQTMSSLIRTYDEAPEQEVLQNKMAQLQKHIKRDLVVLDTQVDNLPSEERLSMGNLIMSALKILVTIVWSPVYSPCLSDDFRAWIVDRAIRVLREHVAPKPVLLHYVHLIATQDFRPSIMTQTRAQRILEVLQELSDHISGKAVLSERLLAYQKLIQQSKSTMKARPEMWVKHVFTALGHSFKEVRGAAISAGTEACTAFAGVPSIAAAARAALAETNGDRTLSVSLTNRLERILAAKDEANQIPQIWTLVLLLCNGGSLRIDTWEQLHDWLKLIQRCFNSSDMTVRVQAFLAWNRLYFIARPHEASEKVVSMLAKPAMVQLDKTGSAQSSKGTRQAVISSYCMLLYYAFRPSASSVQYTRMWNEFVVKLMTRSFLSKSVSNCDLSCRILAALLHSSLSKTRVWNENRAHENAALDPLELPAIECKWVRSKTPSILSIIRLIVEFSSFGPSGSMSEQAYAPQVWRHLMRAIKESTTKEIKASHDTTSALNSIVDFLNPLGNKSQSTIDDIADYARRLSLLSRISVAELGTAPILQVIKSHNRSGNSILLASLIHSFLESYDKSTDEQSLVIECLGLLKEDLKVFDQPKTGSRTSAEYILLQHTGDVLEDLKNHNLCNLLSMLQDSLLNIIRDTDNHLPEEKDTDETTAAYRRFCDVVFELYDGIEPSKQEEFLPLLSAAASSSHSWTRDLSLTRLGDAAPSPEKATLSSVEIDVLSRDPQAILADKSAGPTPMASATKSTGSRQRQSKKKPRHEDSQIIFVPVESSPPAYTFESQLLTTNQKEVRARQEAEPAITFGNVHSSPSVTENRTPIPTRRLSRLSTPVIAGTPTSPGGDEDEEQPPTPTPKARRSQRLDPQPDLTSSPPSVSGDGKDNTSFHITSSPVKETTEVDGALSFEEIGRGLARTEDEEIFRALDTGNERASEINYLSARDQAVNELAVEEHIVRNGSTNEEYETAEIDNSSPIIYSDEFDALAASQLSQSLEETSFMTTNIDDEGTAEQPRTTRKRRAGQREDSSSKKRRISSARNDTITKIEPEEEFVTDKEQADEDTIYVSVETTTPSSSRVTRARASQDGSDQSQVSQRSSKSNTPGSNKVKVPRRRGRPKKVKRGRASQADAANIPIAQQDEADAETRQGVPHVVSPSLGSQVDETEDLEDQDKSALETTTPNIMDGDAKLPPQHGSPEAEDSIENGSLEKTSEDPTTIPDGIVSNLQAILDNLNGSSGRDGSMSSAELATIHSLCFRIGLKAQELTMR